MLSKHSDARPWGHVRVEDAETVFATLTGDVVEPRRDLIITNALKVATLPGYRAGGGPEHRANRVPLWCLLPP